LTVAVRVLRAYALAFPLIFATAFAVQWARTDAERDTAIYYRGATNPDHGLSIYAPLPEPGLFRGEPVYIYPPPLAAALRPISRLGYAIFARSWLVILAVAYWLFAAACARIVVGRYRAMQTLVAGGALFFMPGAVHSWNMGNADMIVWASVAVGLAHAGRTRGAALMSAALLKITPLLAFRFACRDRRALTGGLIAFLAAGLITLGFLSPGAAINESVTFLTRVVPSLGQGQGWVLRDQDWRILGNPLPASRRAT
jgi:hypothetical protein